MHIKPQSGLQGQIVSGTANLLYQSLEKSLDIGIFSLYSIWCRVDSSELEKLRYSPFLFTGVFSVDTKKIQGEYPGEYGEFTGRILAEYE